MSNARSALLASRGLVLENDSPDDFSLEIFDEKENLIATGTLSGNIIKYIAVDDGHEGEGLAARVISELVKIAAERNIWHLLLFTKPEEIERFEGTGFNIVAKTENSALLEWGKPDIHDFWKAGACVVNCNPFTFGHRYLIERAASMSDWLFVLVVQEDKSYFSFAQRFEMVKRGTADIKNVTVIPGGEYVISSATFPSYFIKDRADEKIALSHSQLDAEIFASRIAPALGVSVRFVGSEPFCRITSIYNEQLKKILPLHKIEVIEIERLKNAHAAISASRVRELLKSKNFEKLNELIPKTTLELISDLL